MATRTYIAFLTAAPQGGYGVHFEDLPGCVSFGDDLDEAVRNASEALSLHLEGMAEDGDAFPEARTLQQLAQSGDLPTEPFVYAAVSAEEPESPERVNVYLPKSLLRQMEAFGRESGVDNRSTLLRMAARQYLQRERSRPDRIPARFADFAWKQAGKGSKVAEMTVVDQRLIISGQQSPDMNFDRNMGASISSWMKGEPRYTPEGVFVVLLERGFHDLDSLMQVLGQFARVEGCEWAEKMQYAVSDRIERSAA